MKYLWNFPNLERPVSNVFRFLLHIQEERISSDHQTSDPSSDELYPLLLDAEGGMLACARLLVFFATICFPPVYFVALEAAGAASFLFRFFINKMTIKTMAATSNRQTPPITMMSNGGPDWLTPVLVVFLWRGGIGGDFQSSWTRFMLVPLSCCSPISYGL